MHNNTICNVNYDWQQTLRRLEGAYAPSTLLAYRADLQAYVDWCQTQGLPPFPATPDAVSSFITHETQKKSHKTIKRRLCAIRKIHKLLRLQSTLDDEDVFLALRRARRLNPTPPSQALGLTRDLRERLTAACPDTLQGKRDRALLAVGADTLARRSELASLLLENLRPLPQGGAEIHITATKNDVEGRGRLAHISPPTMRRLADWLQAANISKGPIFRPVIGGQIGLRPLHPHTIGRTLKNIARRAGLTQRQVDQISGHSLRVGAAQDMMTDGLSLLPIMRAGGWRSPAVVARYVEGAELSNLMRRRHASYPDAEIL